MQNVTYDLTVFTQSTHPVQRDPNSSNLCREALTPWELTWSDLEIEQSLDNHLIITWQWRGKGVAELLVDLNIEMLQNYQMETKQKDSRG